MEIQSPNAYRLVIQRRRHDVNIVVSTDIGPCHGDGGIGGEGLC